MQEGINKAHYEDLQDHRDWKELVQTVDQVLKRDQETYLKVIEEYAPFEYISEFGSGFEIFTCDEDSGILEVEFEVKASQLFQLRSNLLLRQENFQLNP